MRKTSAVLLASAGLLAVLSGCSAAGTATDPTPDASTPEFPAAATPAAEEPTEASAEPVEWTAPDACTDLDLTPGATLAGPDLGACVGAALSSYGSGRQSVHSGSGSGEIQFRYDPEFEFQTTLDTDQGDVGMTLIDGVMWIDQGSGWVRGDVDSADIDEQMAGVVGELYRIFSDPNVAVDLIAASPSWTVGAVEPFELGNGETSQAHGITSTAAFTWNEIPVSEYVLWFEDDWTPAGSEATLEVFGVADTARQTYYDLGEPVEIVPVE